MYLLVFATVTAAKQKGRRVKERQKKDGAAKNA